MTGCQASINLLKANIFVNKKKKNILKTGIKTEKKKKFKYFMSFFFLF